MALLWALFWLHDQRMYDDDYGRWLNPAQDSSYPALIAALLRPFPPDWGFLDRPGVMLSFKLGRDVFGSEAGRWFGVKAAAFASLLGVFVLLAQAVIREAGLSGRAASVGAAAAGVLVLTSEPAFASLLWLSDLEVVAQLAVVAGLLLFLRALSADGSKRLASLVLLVLVAFVGFKFKATAKLLPLLLAVHVVLFARGRRTHLVAPIALLVAVCVPWGALGDTPVPPMLDYGGSSPWFHWRPANLSALGGLLWGGGPALWPAGDPTGLPTGLVETWFPFGLTLTSAGLLLLVRAARTGPADAGRLVLIWLSFLLVTLSIAPDIPGPLLGRYLFAVQLPLALLAGLTVAWAWERAGGRKGRAVLLLALTLVLLQVAVSARHTQTRKRSQACQMSIADKTAAYVHSSLRGSTVFFLDYPEPTFDKALAANEVVSVSRGDPSLEQRLRAPGSRAALVTDSALPAGAPWALVKHLRAEDARYWTWVGPPLGRCERFLYTPLRR